MGLSTQSIEVRIDRMDGGYIIRITQPQTEPHEPYNEPPKMFVNADDLTNYLYRRISNLTETEKG